MSAPLTQHNVTFQLRWSAHYRRDSISQYIFIVCDMHITQFLDFNLYQYPCFIFPFFLQQPDTSVASVAKSYFSQMKQALTKIESLFVLRAQAVATAPDNGDMLRTGGFGFAQILECLDLPEHPFFRKGRMFKVNVCHGNLLETDDAGSDIRMAFLRLQDPDETLDLVMQTGGSNMFYNLATYAKFVQAVSDDNLKEWAMESPAK
jgi:hypothetical protein